MIRCGTPEQEYKWDSRRYDACIVILNRIDRKTQGWRSMLRPFYQKTIDRLWKEANELELSQRQYLFDKWKKNDLIKEIKQAVNTELKNRK